MGTSDMHAGRIFLEASIRHQMVIRASYVHQKCIQQLMALSNPNPIVSHSCTQWLGLLW